MVDNDADALKALGQRITKAISFGGGRLKVAQRTGIHVGTIDRYMAGKTEPSALKLASIADVCEVEIAWLLGQRGHAEILELIPTALADTPPARLDADFVPVPYVDVKASAGAGRLVLPGEGEADAIMMLKVAWLRSIGVSPRHAQIITAVGDSMEETIRDGDLLLVDRGIDRVMDNGIYVVALAGLVLVKRLQVRFDGAITLISDNPKYPTETVPRDQTASLQVEGRVRWFGRTI